MQRGAKAAEAGIEAAEFLRDKMLSCFTRGRQNWRLVEEFRQSAAEHIIKTLREEYAGDGILCPALTLSKDTETGCTWLLEPLVGQRNYGRGYPVAAVSLGAYVEEDGMLYGAVVDIFRQVLYRAAKGQGAFQGADRLKVSGETNPDDLLLMIEAPHDQDPADQGYFNSMLGSSAVFGNIRAVGCPALALCNLAAARADVFAQMDIDSCSVSAGALILEEAGGKTSMFSGDPFSIHGEDLLASNGPAHEFLLDAFRFEEEMADVRA